VYYMLARCLITLLIGSCLLSNAFSQLPSDPFICGHHATAKALFKDDMQFRQSRSFTSTYDIKYHRLEWTIDPNVYHISGTVTTYFAPYSNNFQDVFFDLSDSLQVDSVKYHGNTLAHTRPGNHLLKIELPTAINANQLDSITVHYVGVPDSNGFGSFVQDYHDAVPVIWSLSEPYGARDWWPCKQNLNDKIDSIDVLVTTPNAYRVASNGLLVNELTVGPDKVYHWKHRYPIPAYLIAIAVTNYEEVLQYIYLPTGDTIDIVNYVYPEDTSAWQQSFGVTNSCMLHFCDRFELYPFHEEKYGHAQFSWGGGMEHQTMSFMRSTYPPLIAHELAHQWFGDKITCGSWHDIWLNEGFATYLYGLQNERSWTNDWYPWKRNVINHITSEPDGSVYVSDTTSVARIFDARLSYNKGAMLLHMLRWKMGDADFFTAIQNYLADPNLAFSYARTSDLIWHLENQSGVNLTEFFDDWFYGEGFPSYQIEGCQHEGQLEFTVHQTTSHISVDFFEMPIPIHVYGAGQDTMYRFEHSYSGQTFTVPAPFAVDSIAFDADMWLVSANNEVSMEISAEVQVEIFPNPTTGMFYVNACNPIDHIAVFSPDGKLVYSKANPVIPHPISMDNMAEGVYVVEVFSQGKQTKHKLVRAKQ
jgi:aminopeptidase N